MFATRLSHLWCVPDFSIKMLSCKSNMRISFRCGTENLDQSILIKHSFVLFSHFSIVPRIAIEYKFDCILSSTTCVLKVVSLKFKVAMLRLCMIRYRTKWFSTFFYTTVKNSCNIMLWVCCRLSVERMVSMC